ARCIPTCHTCRKARRRSFAPRDPARTKSSDGSRPTNGFRRAEAPASRRPRPPALHVFHDDALALAYPLVAGEEHALRCEDAQRRLIQRRQQLDRRGAAGRIVQPGDEDGALEGVVGRLRGYELAGDASVTDELLARKRNPPTMRANDAKAHRGIV